MLVILRIMPQCLIRCVWLDENLICDERAKNFKKFIFIFYQGVRGDHSLLCLMFGEEVIFF